MDEITLSEYCDEAKELVRADSYDQAVAICRHILKHYPKYLRAYRLLGEACLEKGDYVEAANLFKRVMGADLEDMVVYVGLGIIFDEQGAVEEAIYQLQRAFELNPGNAEIRKELQRLYSERDGEAPPKLKLTPAALGRLYMREELYQRAIDEFRGVLKEDPDRADVQIALAQALWWSDQRQEAAKICEDLLDQYPNCLKANLILGQILLDSGREAEAQTLLEVAQDMDPENAVAYELFRDKSPLSPETVTVPRLDREEMEKDIEELSAESPVAAKDRKAGKEPSAAEAERPADEATPDWLRKLQEEEKDPSAEGAVPSIETQEMPTWLRELAEDDATPAAEQEESGEPTHEIADEGIPTWLAGLGEATEEPPSGEALSPAEPEVAPGPEEQVPVADESMAEAILETLVPAEDKAEPVDLQDEGPPLAEAGDEEGPDWLSSLRPAATEEPPAAEGQEDVLARLRDLEPEGPSDESEAETEPTATTWAEEEPSTSEETPRDVSDETIDQLRDTMPDESASIEEIMEWMDKSKALLAEEELPEGVLDEIQADVEEPEPSAEAIDEGQVPTWLRDLGPEAESAEDALLDEVSEASAEPAATPTQEDEIPSWLMKLRPKEVEDEQAVLELEEGLSLEEAEPVSEEAPPEVQEPPSLERGLPEEAVVEQPPVVSQEPETGEGEAEPLLAEAEDMPPWLRELREEAMREEPYSPEEKTALDETEAPAAEEETPSSLRDLSAEEAGGEPAALEEEHAEMPAGEAPLPAVEEEEGIPSWLRQLRAEAASEEVSPQPEALEAAPEPAEPSPAEEEAVPSWLRELRAEADRHEPLAPAEESEVLPEEEEAQAHMVEAELPSWLEELRAEVAREGPPLETDETETVSMEDVPAVEEPIEAIRREEPEVGDAAAPPLEEEAVPSWLRELRAQAAEGETDALLEKAEAEDLSPAPLEEAEVPSWLRELRAESAPEAAVAPPVAAETPAVGAPAEEVEVWPEEEAEEPSREAAPPPIVEEQPPAMEPAAEEEEEAPAVRPAERAPQEIPRPAEDIDRYIAQLEAKPRDHSVRLALARAYSQAGDLDQAAQQYQVMLSFGGMIQEVIADLETTAESTPDHLPTHELLADAYMRSGELQKALDKYRWLRVRLAD
jgi:tetratricopeptide (TPR) repeat protein